MTTLPESTPCFVSKRTHPTTHATHHTRPARFLAGRPQTVPPRSVKSLHSPSPTFTPNTTSTLPPADIISAVEFDKSGEHLATGDRGGRVVLFERLRHSKTSLETMRGDERNRDAEKNDLNGQKRRTTHDPPASLPDAPKRCLLAPSKVCTHRLPPSPRTPHQPYPQPTS